MTNLMAQLIAIRLNQYNMIYACGSQISDTKLYNVVDILHSSCRGNVHQRLTPCYLVEIANEILLLFAVANPGDKSRNNSADGENGGKLFSAFLSSSSSSILKWCHSYWVRLKPTKGPSFNMFWTCRGPTFNSRQTQCLHHQLGTCQTNMV